MKLIQFIMKKHINAVSDNIGLSCFTGNYYLLRWRLIDVWIVITNCVNKVTIYGMWLVYMVDRI